ncbi:chorismate transformation enzyme, FkbO/Hyg5 family [Variovorax atrisoli]|uniref:chorismate transformation enzyme, FkbO/Hyg5 family n=1 Tax=Variovorax atrisoli TaxID=3394203 RepID=UPI0017DF2F17|nr:Rid family hydrolase [Variovorax sp. BK613]MBB3637373.1 enamine deaminase RidA (YjgF/YER057c/UK114 family) [Variovorax sp. BK613]
MTPSPSVGPGNPDNPSQHAPLPQRHEPHLRVERMSLAASLALADDGEAPFAALGYGTPHGVAWMPTVNARVLSDGGAMADVWHASGARIESGTTGIARWRTDGHWLLGAIDLDESAEKQGLAELAHRAYRDLFKTLDQAGTPHLQRIWNYLPQINADGGGLERYRQFNLGRQEAFLEAGRAAFEGAPAACALGIHQGALSIRFLAGQRAPLPVENPRQVSAYRYPETYGPRSPTFSRAALADIGGGSIALFISGTASIVGHETVHHGDVQEQTRETLRNLQAVVEAANARCSAKFSLSALDSVVYVRHPSDTATVRAIIEETLGSDAPMARHAVYLEADICRSDLLVEIEAHAVAAGQLRA